MSLETGVTKGWWWSCKFQQGGFHDNPVSGTQLPISTLIELQSRYLPNPNPTLALPLQGVGRAGH